MRRAAQPHWIEGKGAAPGCNCKTVIGGLSTVLIGDGLPREALPAAQCRCGRTAMQINTKRIFHRVSGIEQVIPSDSMPPTTGRRD